jgi:predicted  nucleic acid-binding Zn-ribbon protein
MHDPRLLGGLTMIFRRSLEEEIEYTRKEMEKAAMELGLSHPHVIEISQELDELHNQWNRLNEEVKESSEIYMVRPYAMPLRGVAAVRA